MTQPAATTDRDTRTRAQDPAEALVNCQVCGAARTPQDSIFCRVCGEPVIVCGWAP
ncbi:MAG: hypothetical protein Q7W02_21600 [Candidatus Rokubacteria bacterium]|nr:hypothetical protein [Candidatus Rokubacteria bacterium]